MLVGLAAMLPAVHLDLQSAAEVSKIGYERPDGGLTAKPGADAVVEFTQLAPEPPLLRGHLAPEALRGRPLHVLLVGEGAERPRIEAEAARVSLPHGGRVHLAGHRTDLAAFYSAFDVFTLTSDSEQQPVSLLEAMATGAPVAATDVGDIAASLPPEARRFTVPLGPETDGALARTYGELLADAELREELSTAGRAHVVKEFSLERMAKAYEALWRGALGRR